MFPAIPVFCNRPTVNKKPSIGAISTDSVIPEPESATTVVISEPEPATNVVISFTRLDERLHAAVLETPVGIVRGSLALVEQTILEPEPATKAVIPEPKAVIPEPKAVIPEPKAVIPEPEPATNIVASVRREMKSETNGVAEPTHEQTISQGYRWIECKSCGGNVGVPNDWDSQWVECPECGEKMKVRGELLYRAPTTKRTIAPSGEKPSEPAKPSHSLEYKSHWAFILGIACIVLGWTFVVPMICWAAYWDAWQLADAEKVPVPVKATVGLVVSILFGVTQVLAILAHVR